MPFDLNVRHLASLPDTLWKTDPWGLGLGFEVLRADHSKWVRWQELHGGQDMTKLAIARVGRVMLSRVIAQGVKSRKIGDDSASAASAESLLSSVDADELAEQVASQISPEDLEGVMNRDTNALKLGVARVLLRDWDGVVEDGEPCEFHYLKALEFLGWQGVAAVPNEGQELLPEFFDTMEAVTRKSRAAAEAGLVQLVEFEGVVRAGDSDEQIHIPSGQPYGPAPFGDALLAFLLATADEGSFAHAERIRETEADLEGSRGGESAASQD